MYCVLIAVLANEPVLIGFLIRGDEPLMNDMCGLRLVKIMAAESDKVLAVTKSVFYHVLPCSARIRHFQI